MTELCWNGHASTGLSNSSADAKVLIEIAHPDEMEMLEHAFMDRFKHFLLHDSYIY
jgi:hypothetical protein